MPHLVLRVMPLCAERRTCGGSGEAVTPALAPARQRTLNRAVPRVIKVPRRLRNGCQRYRHGWTGDAVGHRRRTHLRRQNPTACKTDQPTACMPACPPAVATLQVRLELSLCGCSHCGQSSHHGSEDDSLRETAGERLHTTVCRASFGRGCRSRTVCRTTSRRRAALGHGMQHSCFP